MSLERHILGCILGTMAGDAVGLRREGLSRQRALRLYGNSPLQPALLLGLAFCSDDSEHTCMVARALALAGGDVNRFERQLAVDLKRWLLTMPAGVGFATLRACLKLLVGIGPRSSGVFSAGNGPAMRSALIGVCAVSDDALLEFVRASTRITHTDPRAEAGALLVAQAARLAAIHSAVTPVEFIRMAAASAADNELRATLQAAAEGLAQGMSCVDFALSRGWTHGVSGYVNHTVPAALYCWASSPNDFRRCVENAVLLGGDTDSVAAITGAICGANLRSDAVPAEWIARLTEWPRTAGWTRRLARELAIATTDRTISPPPSMHWLATVPRNALFAALVIALGIRRLFPPY
jgi:ADP-ribosyl-[dinitrogen reductase] hydrolase